MIAAHGLSAESPPGWDAEIYARSAARVQVPSLLLGHIVAPLPILHLANFPLPPTRGDYGSGAVEAMGADGIFVSLMEHTPDEAQTALFSQGTIPWPLHPDSFRPETMQRTIPGQAGHQSFFAHEGRGFCLYVVIGSLRDRGTLVPEANVALEGVRMQ